MRIIFYSDEIKEFIKSLEERTIMKLLRVFDLLNQHGNNIGMPYSKRVAKGLFELRIRGKQEVRFLYAFRGEKIVIILCGFIKKTRKIPKEKLRLAKKRKKQIDGI